MLPRDRRDRADGADSRSWPTYRSFSFPLTDGTRPSPGPLKPAPAITSSSRFPRPSLRRECGPRCGSTPNPNASCSDNSPSTTNGAGRPWPGAHAGTDGDGVRDPPRAVDKRGSGVHLPLLVPQGLGPAAGPPRTEARPCRRQEAPGKAGRGRNSTRPTSETSAASATACPNRARCNPPQDWGGPLWSMVHPHPWFDV